MFSNPHPRSLTLAQRRCIARVAGALIAMIGALALGGWVLGIQTLKSFPLGATQMAANTAAALLLVGTAIAVARRCDGPRRWFAPAVGIAVAALGMVTLGEYVLHVDLVIDQLLVRNQAVASGLHAGRMSPLTAWALMLAGLWLASRRAVARGWLGAVCALQIVAIAAVSLLGHLWTASEFAPHGWAPTVPGPTAFALLLLGSALLLKVRQPRTGNVLSSSPTRSEKRVRLSFWAIVAVLLASTSYTYGSNIAFVHSTQAVADTQHARLDLARLDVCLDEVQARHERLLLTDAAATESELTRSLGECRGWLRELTSHLAGDRELAHESVALSDAMDQHLQAVERNLAILAERGAPAARDAWRAADTQPASPTLDSRIEALDAKHAERLNQQLGALDLQRAAMLVSLIVTLLACVTILTALTRVMVRTVRENTRSREEAERQKLLLSAVLRSTPDSVAYRAPDGTYLGANAAYARMVARPGEQLVGRKIIDVFEAQAASAFKARDEFVLRSGESTRHEDWFTCDDGSRQLFEMLRSPLRDVNGRVVGVLAVGRNMTQRKAMEEEAQRARLMAEEAAQLKTTFLANMSHEIRTPMTAVLGLVDLLAAGDLSSPQRRHVEAMRTSGRHLLSIINDILDFSRLEAGKLPLESVDFSLPQLLQELDTLLEPMAAERGLALEIGSQPHVPDWLRGDPMRLRQILLNLAGNALKFTPRGTVRLWVSAAGGGTDAQLEFEVRDTGIGMAPDKLRMLFTPFTQADQSTARTYGGSGLGLAISKRLAEAMGGRLTAASTQGVGSVFRLQMSLPLGKPKLATLPSSPLARASRPLRILVAEDVEINREILRAALTAQGHHVEFAINGAEAVERVQAAQFDLVLMDVQMPVLDGVEATRRIRRLPAPLCNIPILGLSANVLVCEQREYVAAGMNECLPKPIDWSQLADAIARHGGTSGSAADAAPAGSEPTSPLVTPGVLDARQLESVRATMGSGPLAALITGAVASLRATSETLKEERSLPRVRALAHKLKGTSGTLGMAAVYRTAAGIEAAAAEGHLATDAIERLPGEIQATDQALRALGFPDEGSEPDAGAGAASTGALRSPPAPSVIP